MTAVRDSGGVLRTIRGVALRDTGGVLRTAAGLHVRDAGGVLRSVLTNLSATIAPTYTRGFANSYSTVRMTTGEVTATPVGGTAPFTYAWTLADTTWVADAATSQTTSFTSPAIPTDDSATTTATCTITDAGGNTATSPTCSLMVNNVSGR